MTTMTALDFVQSALENIARVRDAHGDLFAREEDGPIFSLGIAEEHLSSAESLLEHPNETEAWVRGLIRHRDELERNR